MSAYDFAISFAGEDRDKAEEIVTALSLRGLKVFYDTYEQASLWGKDLYSHLTKIYRDEAKFCIILVSENYAKKLWTNHERVAAQARAFRENREYILPIRLDDAEVEGILDTTGYIDFRSNSLEKVVSLLEEKIHRHDSESGINNKNITIAEVFKRALEFEGKENCTDGNFETKCPSCNSSQKLSEALISSENKDTIYNCKNGCQKIVVISRPSLNSWPGRGYRLGEYTIRNIQELTFKINTMSTPISLPASSAALMKIVSPK